MSTDMTVLIIITIMLTLGSGLCGLLLTILIGLATWTLKTVSRLSTRVAAMEQRLTDLPCNGYKYKSDK